MNNKYLNPDDAILERKKNADGTSSVDLYDCDGAKRFTFPGSMTDYQIMVSLQFANKAYSAGFQWGEQSKLHQVRAVLGLEA